MLCKKGFFLTFTETKLKPAAYQKDNEDVFLKCKFHDN